MDREESKLETRLGDLSRRRCKKIMRDGIYCDSCRKIRGCLKQVSEGDLGYLQVGRCRERL